MLRRTLHYVCTALPLAFLAACSNQSGEINSLQATAESCMLCHNGSPHNDYAGPGMENPHPFGSADNLRCTTCHGGHPDGEDLASSHVPPPPQIGDREFQDNNNHAYFNRLTLTGIDKFPDYTVNGRTYRAIDYLQFVNPGDLRVVTEGRSCGQCHQGHVDCVEGSLLATSAGIFSGATYAIGAENKVPESQGDYGDTAADTSFRAISDPAFDEGTASLGGVARLLEFPVYSKRNANGPMDIDEHPELYDAAVIGAGRNADGTVVSNSPLANLYHEQIAFTCGDCHLGSAGANNRYGDYRSSGCTSCHMQYSLDGRSRISDPNVRKNEPADPDDIDDPERPHVQRHMIRSVAKTLPSGELIQGINDYACAGCHQGSNRTVMQYWGIRLDQNQDVRRGFQYPAQPDSYTRTFGDTRLFDPVVGNHEFNGRNGNQYLLEEDYDGDGRDDTPPDVHYEAGLGCIDCHTSYDLHGGNASDPGSREIFSRMEQAVAIRCESCHGAVDSYAPTTTGTMFNGETGEIAVDSKGNPLNHVVKEADGNYYLYSKLTGTKHFVSQTLDAVVDSGKTNPFTGNPIYTEMASYAMGKADGVAGTGIGPLQSGGPSGFSHADANVSCVACHASWTNSCIGCHLKGEFDNNFSNITGDRIVFEEDEAQFVYQSPVPFQLGIGPNNEIVPYAANTDMFFQWEDKEDDESEIFAFSDRNAQGANSLTSNHPSLSHNSMMPHSIRGRVNNEYEGPRYCVACHLTTDGLTNYGTEYAELQSAMQSPTLAGLDEDLFDTLAEHIGQNTGNDMNSPLWVHMVAGLGTGLFLFDDQGRAINSLDDNDDRYGCNDVAPADRDLATDLPNVAYNLDRIVTESGTPTGSSNHPILEDTGPSLRAGTLDPTFAGPLTGNMAQRLTNTNPMIGIILDAWVDANGVPNAALTTILNNL